MDQGFSGAAFLWGVPPGKPLASKVQGNSPDLYNLVKNFPNPFAGDTRLSCLLPHSGSARIIIVNLRGATVRHLIDQPLSAGQHQFSWDGKDDLGVHLPSGEYFVVLFMDGFRQYLPVQLIH
jgi:hypothetical protein